MQGLWGGEGEARLPWGDLHDLSHLSGDCVQGPLLTFLILPQGTEVGEGWVQMTLSREARAILDAYEILDQKRRQLFFYGSFFGSTPADDIGGKILAHACTYLTNQLALCFGREEV